MGIGYALAYRLGIKPWERAGRAGAAQLTQLLQREERDRPRPPGRALDLGCGTGGHTLELAERGWQATGVDNVERAVQQARARPGAESVRFLVGDVTALDRLGIPPGVDFFLDVGCFHGLSSEQRAAYGRGVTSLATDGATLLMLAFQPGRRVAIPGGVSTDDVTAAFPGWSLASVDDADSSALPRPLRRLAPRWVRLRR